MHHPNETAGSIGDSEKAPKRVQRDLLFDAMKGFGILLVIMGHALQGSSEHFDDNFAFRLIYSFHMPLFFFISGYVFQFGLAGKKLAPTSFLLKKGRALMVPFLSWYLIFGLWRGIPTDVTYSEYFLRFLHSPDYGYWFLWVLFLCFLAFLPLAWLQQRLQSNWHAGLVALSFFCFYFIRQTPTGDYGLGLLRIHYFYFAAGFFLCYWRKQLSFFRNWWPEICIVGFLLLVPYWRRATEMPFQPFLTKHFPSNAQTLSDIFEFCLALLGIGSVAQIVKMLISGRVGRWLAWIGRYTLDIYVIHLLTFSLLPLGELITNRSDTFIIALEVAWGFSASLAISFLVLRQSVILRFLFLGILDAPKPMPAAAIS